MEESRVSVRGPTPGPSHASSQLIPDWVPAFAGMSEEEGWKVEAHLPLRPRPVSPGSGRGEAQAMTAGDGLSEGKRSVGWGDACAGIAVLFRG